MGITVGVLPLGLITFYSGAKERGSITKLVSVILPSYNERENLMVLIPKIRAAMKRLPAYTAEIIVVDDDSPDNTAETIQKHFGAKVRLIVRKRIRGLATAIRMGIEHAHGDIIIGMDADGNHDPGSIPLLLHALTTADLVVGSRFIRGGGMTDRARYTASWLFNAVLRYVLLFPVWDNTSGYYAIGRKALLRMKPERIYVGYGDYHLRLVYAAKMSGFRIREVPVVYGNRRYGQSKSRLFIMAVSYLRTATNLFLGKR